MHGHTQIKNGKLAPEDEGTALPRQNVMSLKPLI
jgi:hypothetical protein